MQARDAHFDEQFDADTLFFDAVRAPGGRRAVLLGPPLFNLAPAFAAVTVYGGGGGRLNARIRHLDRHMQMWVSAPPGVTSLTLETPIGRLTVPVADSQAGVFAGRRVLLTRSHDNPLPWIQDWIRFNRDVNGADAVLLYDNASTLYTLDDLRAAVGSIAGIEAAVVVRWPFKFGPQGPDASHYWDSDFCELGAWEHARWTFLQEARSVLAGDVDEFAFGGASVFEAAETSLFGIARYSGRWIVGLSDAGASGPNLAARRHRDYETVLKANMVRGRLGRQIDSQRCAAKWTVVPARCPAYAQWGIHTIRSWAPSYLTRADMTFAHFRSINTSWKYQRDDAVFFDPALHERHDALANAMARVDWSR